METKKKRKKTKLPGQRSMEKLRKEGWLVAVVEKWNPHRRIRQDMFGFADLLAVKGDEVLLVQATTSDNAAARVSKIKENQNFYFWVSSPNRRVVVHGWAKCGPQGKRKLWTCRETEVEESL